MSITIEDFEKEFINKFSQEHQDYIVNFCNTFQKAFPGILDKEVLIKRISTISSIDQVEKLNHDEGGRTEYSDGKNVIKYIDDLSEKDKKNVIYHELLHVLSRHTEEYYNDAAGLTIEGFREFEADSDDFYYENRMLDEIMNEFYTVKLLEFEEKIKEKYMTIDDSKSMYDTSIDKFRYYGNGYKDRVQLAEILNNMFENDLLKAKLLSGKSFREMFNQKYKDLDIPFPQGDGLPPVQKITPFERFQFQIGLGGMYKPFETAVDIWKINEKEYLKENNFSLYEYLKKTKELISFLPVREDNGAYRGDKSNICIPSRIFEKLQQMDSEFINEYINPNKDKDINILLSVINILRENIQDLSKQDIENISYGKIKEYTHNGRDCLIINTKSTDFMTFVNNTIENNHQFSAYSKFKKFSEFKDFGYTEETEKEFSKELAEKGCDVKDYTYAMVWDSKQYGLVKSNGSYYRTSGEISKVNLSDIETIEIRKHKFKEDTISFELTHLIGETKITDFNEMSNNIKNKNEQLQALDDERI